MTTDDRIGLEEPRHVRRVEDFSNPEAYYPALEVTCGLFLQFASDENIRMCNAITNKSVSPHVMGFLIASNARGEIR